MAFSGNYQIRYVFTFESSIMCCFHIGSCYSWQVNTLIDFSFRQNLRTNLLFFLSNVFIQLFDFIFLGIFYCGIPFPVHSQMSLWLAILAHTPRTVLSSTNLFLREGRHIISILQNLVQENDLGVGGYYNYFVLHSGNTSKKVEVNDP